MSRLACLISLLGVAAVLLATPATAQRRNLYPDTPQAQPSAPIPAAPDRGGRLEYGDPYVGGYANYNGRVGGYGGYGYPYSNVHGNITAGNTLQGLASYTQAYGQYLNDAQQASMLREQVRQTKFDTYRKQVQWEIEYEKYQMTAPKLKAKENATDLTWARNYAEKNQMWSGWALNVLLKSVLKSSTPAKGPYISLDERQLAGINLTDGTTRGNLSMAKDQGKLTWPESLQDAAFDETRESFSKNFVAATKSVESGESPPIPLLRELRSDLKKLQGQLDDQIQNLTPVGYTDGRKILNKLSDTVKGFSDPRVVKSGRIEWKKDIRTVADLIDYCVKNGLEFGPAGTANDQPSYTAMYYAMRDYERGVSRYISAQR